MDRRFRLRQVEAMVVAIVLLLLAGTIGFRLPIHETWLQSSYLLVIAGITIVGCATAAIVEAIGGRVLAGALSERRRRRAIERLEDHFIIRGFERVGLTIVARASNSDAEKKIELAGADRVVTPYQTAGREMANLVLKAQVTTPEPDAAIGAGDVLVGVGAPDEIRRLEELFAPHEALAG